MPNQTCRVFIATLIATATLAAAQSEGKKEKPADENIVTLEKFVAAETKWDPTSVMPNDPTDALGLMKKPIEMPRTLTMVSSELIGNLSLSNVTDLTVVAPNTFSTSRWGVQGNIDIRGQGADIYFRGMKRIEPQGNSRTVLGANDQIEVVKGPPPAYFGAGKVGGYTNMSPKAGRSRQGSFLDKDQGFYQLIVGGFGRREISFSYGGPLRALEGKKGGFYIYGMVDDSDSYFQHVPGRQRIVQAALSQEVSRNWRLEAGLNYQETIAAGASTTRLTRDMIQNGNVWAGRPLWVLDTDGSGKISRKEMEVNSPNPLTSTLSSGSMGSLGGSFSGAAIVTGSNTRADINNPRANSALQALVQLRPAFVAKITDQKTLNLLNVIPRGLVLDPDTVHEAKMDFSAVALEKELRAKISLAYLDFVNDLNPDLSFKNQMFFDKMDQFKDSELPYYQKLDQYCIEEKFTMQKRITHLPGWLALNTITSVNVRNVRSGGRSGGGDYDDRADLTLPYNQRTASDLFVSPKENSTYEGGLPFTADNDTVTTESGIGTLADLILFNRLNIIAGGRYDYVDVMTIAHAGTFSTSSGTSGNPAGRYKAADTRTKGYDRAPSWSFSVTYKLPLGIVSYYTYTVQAVLQDGGNISGVGASAITNQAVFEDATLKEVGIKGSMFKEHLYWALSAYQQGKTSITLDTTGAEITSGSVDTSISKGTELELRWVPNKQFYITGYGVIQKATSKIPSPPLV